MDKDYEFFVLKKIVNMLIKDKFDFTKIPSGTKTDTGNYRQRFLDELEEYQNSDDIESVFNTIQTDRTDTQIWKWFVWITLLFLVLELLIQKFVK